ncbi:MAG: putative membrane protein YccC [Alloalcanivorax sp.]|jgi:uncharacterized membrane protein YccC
MVAATVRPPAFLREAGRRQWQFTFRTFSAGMLALYIALALGLDEPKWALMTVYIVAQPLGGMVLAKGIYRLLGTLAGAAMAVLLVATLAQLHTLFFLALAVWLGLCTLCASLLRNFRSYAFVLAGYSALIVGVPAVLQPDQAFTMAVARVTEIGLGILCVSLMSVLVWPQSAGRTYLQQSREQLVALIRLVSDSAAGRLDGPALQRRRQALITSGMALEAQREHALFDSAHLRRHAGLCRRLGHEMLALISSVGPLNTYVNRYAERHHQDQVTLLLADIATLDPEASPAALRETLSALYQRARDLARSLRGERLSDDEQRFYALQLALEHSAELCDRLRSSVALYAMLTDQATPVRWRAGTSRLHLDYGQAWRNGARAALALAATVVLWFWSAAPQGAAMVIQVGVICALFSTRDDPLAAVKGFINGALLATVLAALYRLVLLPASDGFAALVLWLAPLYLLAGLAMARPATVATGTALTIFFPLLLDLRPVQDFSAAPLFNNIIGLGLGMGFAVLAFLLLWPGDDAARARRRLCRDLCRTLGRWPIRRRRPRHEMESLLYDRISRTLPRLDPDDPRDGELLQGALAAVTLGLGLLYMDALCRRGVPAPVRLALTRLIRDTQRALRDGDPDRWLALAASADTVAGQCRRAYDSAASDGERRRLVRAVVRLRMQINIIRGNAGFFLCGSGDGAWRGLEANGAA